MSGSEFPSLIFTYGPADANGNYFPVADSKQKGIKGIARQISWNSSTFNVEAEFKKPKSKQEAENFIFDQSNKVKALANVFFNDTVSQMHIAEGNKLNLKLKDGTELKSPHAISKELNLRKTSLEAKLKTLITDEEKRKTGEELQKVLNALGAFQSGNILKRMAGWFKNVFVVDATAIAKAIETNPPVEKKEEDKKSEEEKVEEPKSETKPVEAKIEPVEDPAKEKETVKAEIEKTEAPPEAAKKKRKKKKKKKPVAAATKAQPTEKRECSST